MHQDKDRGAQWLFSHFGLGILKLAGVAHIAECRTVKEGLVAPRRMPDGLMEVTFTDRPGTALFLIEIESYASADADRQMLENLTVVVADRREMPEAIILVLRPKGNAQVSGSASDFEPKPEHITSGELEGNSVMGLECNRPSGPK